MALDFSTFNFCDTGACTPAALPNNTVTGDCKCLTISGRLNDILFVPCSEQPTAAQAIDATYWEGLVNSDTLRRFARKGMGSFGQNNVVTQDLGGCGDEQITEMSWNILWKNYCIDRSDLNLDHAFASALLEGCISSYNIWLRPCFDSDVLFPIGQVSITNFDAPLPESTSEKLYFEYTFTYKSLTPPCPINVPGLGAVIPMN